MGLQRCGRNYVSVLCAIQFGSNIHVLSQINDRILRHLSISLVLRSYLLEESIRRGCSGIHFLNGTSPMLGRYCNPVILHVISVDKRKSLSHPIKAAAGSLATREQINAHVPMRLRALLGQNFFGSWTFDEPV